MQHFAFGDRLLESLPPDLHIVLDLTIVGEGQVLGDDIEDMIHSEDTRGGKFHSALTDGESAMRDTLRFCLIKGQELMPVVVDEASYKVDLIRVQRGDQVLAIS